MGLGQSQDLNPTEWLWSDFGTLQDLAIIPAATESRTPFSSFEQDSVIHC